MRILVIEDDPVFQKVLKSVVEFHAPHKIEWTFVIKLSEAMQVIDDSALFDLIITDLTLQDSMPHQTWEALKRWTDTMPVVIMSGDESLYENGFRFLQSGAQEIIAKSDVRSRDAYRTIAFAVERYKASKEIRELERRLSDQQHMATLGVMASGVAHEYNNLNAVIMGNADYQLNRSDLDASATKSFSTILLAAQTSADITKSLLSVAKPSQGRTSVCVKDLLSKVQVLTAHALESEDITITFEQCDEDLHIVGNSGELAQLMMSLILNSRDALRGRSEKYIEVIIHADSGVIRIDVRDNGVGIEESRLSTIFQMFHSTKDSKDQALGGYGIGLAAAKRIVTSHGGTISCSSVVGEGTTFEVSLPLSSSDPSRVEC